MRLGFIEDPAAPTDSTSPGTSPWWDVLNRSIDLTGRILVPRFGVPQVDAGGYYSQTPRGGTQVSRQPSGYPTIPGTFTFDDQPGSGSGLVWIIGAGVLVLGAFAIAGGKK